MVLALYNLLLRGRSRKKCIFQTYSGVIALCIFLLGTGPPQVTRQVLRRVGCRAFTPDLLVCLPARESGARGWLSPIHVAPAAATTPRSTCRFYRKNIHNIHYRYADLAQLVSLYVDKTNFGKHQKLNAFRTPCRKASEGPQRRTFTVKDLSTEEVAPLVCRS